MYAGFTDIMLMGLEWGLCCRVMELSSISIDEELDISCQVTVGPSTSTPAKHTTCKAPRPRPESQVCDVCGKAVKGWDAQMRRHLYLVHGVGEGGKFCCDHCGQSFFEKRELFSHINEVHKKAKPFACSRCSKQFACQRSLTRHRCAPDAPSSETLLHCPTCEKTFLNKSHLTDHQHTHDTVAQFKCPRCFKTMKHRQSLVRHQKKCNGNM
jgi:uncharacterized C2H2 Zn-finger protein